MKAGVIGVGRLGGTLAFALARDGFVDDLAISDVVAPLAWAQAADIRHGLPDANVSVRVGSVEAMEGADLVVLCAGQARKPGMSRMDLLRANAPIVASLARDIARVAPTAALVVLTNPLDVMTVVAQRASGFPREKVLGSGALVDSLRFRIILADRLRVPVADVDATVLGEHGDHAVPLWSRVRVRGKVVSFDTKERDSIREELRTLSSRVIAGKGWTSYGPGGCTAALVRALFGAEPSSVPASVLLAGEYGLRGTAVGVPAIVGNGRLHRVDIWELAADELASLQEAGRELAKFVEQALSAIETNP